MLFGDDGQTAQSGGEGSGEGSGDSDASDEIGGVSEAGESSAPAPVSVEESLQRRTLGRVSDMIDPTLDFTHILRKPKAGE